MKLLYVENHAIFAQTVCQQFLTPHDVTIVATVREAIALLSNEFDAVLVDYDLDDGKGDAFVRSARAGGIAAPIVGVSSHEQGNAALLTAGADSVILKKDFRAITEILAGVVDGQVIDESRVVGAFLGAMVGDAFGCPFEGASRGNHLLERIQRREESSEVWGYSDDSEMMLGVAESLLSCRRVEPEHLLAIFAKNYEPARGYGHGMKLAVRAFESGAVWRDVAYASWRDGSRGNGGAVRVVPIACGYSHAASRRKAARLSARTTHAHEEAMAGAVVQAELIAQLLAAPGDQFDVESLARAALEVAGPLSDRLGRALELVRGNAGPEAAVRELGHGTLAVESVPTAFFAFASSPGDFAHAVRGAVALGGDTDSIAAMVGALAGAFVGVDGIPATWLKRLERGPRGYDYAVRLAKDIRAARLALGRKARL